VRHLVPGLADLGPAWQARQVARARVRGAGPRHVGKGDLDAAVREERERIDAQQQAHDADHDQAADAQAAVAPDRERDGDAPATVWKRAAGAVVSAAVLDLVAFPVLGAVAHGAILSSWFKVRPPCPTPARRTGSPSPLDGG
jgi:hypothetical protein